jgi:YD repeat-containing protein
VTFRYFYDDAGQLQKVVDSTGVVLEYVYDSVGNILEVRRSTSPPGGLKLFSFTPVLGAPLTMVTIRGEGFAGTPTGNIVKFNGVISSVTSATIDTLVTSVPVGATSGPISVTVGSGTATSAMSFMIIAVPVITSIAPAVIDAAAPPAVLQVGGIQLTGATFAFLPAFQPPAITVGTPTANAGGTAATVPVTLAPNARGRFTLVGTNAVGSSSAFASNGNSVRIIGGEDDFDSDGDGFPDRLETLLGSDPFDPESVPNPNAIRAGEVEAPAISVINTGGTAPGQLTTLEADAIAFSTLNLAGVTGGQPLHLEANAPSFSTLNIDPSAPPGASGSGGTGGGGGGGGSGGQPVLFEADAIPFSVNNIAPGAPPAAVQAALNPRREPPLSGSQERGSPARVLDSQSLTFISALFKAVSLNEDLEVRNSDPARRKP